MGEREADGEKRRMRTKAERRRIVEETLEPGASVTQVARSHGVNANQVFKWRQLYREGRLGPKGPGNAQPYGTGSGRPWGVRRVWQV